MSKEKPSETVRVVVRVRPLNATETRDGRCVAVSANHERGEIVIREGDGNAEEKRFSFDQVWGPEATQSQIYDLVASPLIGSVLEGYNATIFAYGQTGAGKSHSMEGLMEPSELRGILPRSFTHIFESIATRTGPSAFLVRASYLEIYNESIRDLLSDDPTASLELKERNGAVYVKDLTAVVVKSADELDAVLQAGRVNRSTGATLMNATSSRSHSLFTITLEQSRTDTTSTGAVKQTFKVGKLNLVDLAGSERQTKTQASGVRLKEAAKINLSLSALGNVIEALTDPLGRTHVPYRDSKLTRLLQDSLGGNTKTVMIANCGPADYNFEESLSTLRYASRAKNIKNKPIVNEDPKEAMLREFQEEIARLRARLAEEEARVSESGGVSGSSISSSSSAAAPGASGDQAEMQRRASQSDEQQLRLQAEIDAKARAHEAALADKAELEKQIAMMSEKLLEGGHVLDAAARQEEQLRTAQLELEERRQQELAMARELEEANTMMEEQYATMADEVESKTRKLKKLQVKLQNTQRELRDQNHDFQVEKEELLDTIRQLEKWNLLKQTILDEFVPPEKAEIIEKRAIWDEENSEWTIQRSTLTGNRLRQFRFPSCGPAILLANSPAISRTTTKRENIVNFDFDIPKLRTQARAERNANELSLDSYE